MMKQSKIQIPKKATLYFIGKRKIISQKMKRKSYCKTIIIVYNNNNCTLSKIRHNNNKRMNI